jgi:hypothetical protein
MNWNALLTLAVQLIGWLLARSAANDKTKAAYYEFLAAIDSDAASSAKLRESAMSQRTRIEAQIDAERAQPQ